MVRGATIATPLRMIPAATISGKGDEMGRRVLGCVGTGLLVLVAVGLLVFLFRKPLLRAVGVNWPEGPGTVADLVMPPGVRATVYAEGLAAPRFMAVGPAGTPWAGWLFVAERNASRVVALPDRDGDGRADERIVVAEGVERVHSLAFNEGALYAAETGQVTRLTLGADGRATGREAVVTDIPAGGIHFTRTILFGADGRLYVATGSSCNVCTEDDPHRAAVWVYPPPGDDLPLRGEPYTVGLRNAVGLALHPQTGAVWATNNGRDLMGDDLPPETVYSLAPGADAGWPRCHAGNIPDPQFGRGAGACEGVLPPLLSMQAHMAPLGLTFYTPTPDAPNALPDETHGDLFIAMHGSWNRAEPVGYLVMRVPLDAGGGVAGEPEPYVTGFRRADGTVAGRPVGFATLPDGALLVSDDHAGIIYRLVSG